MCVSSNNRYSRLAITDAALASTVIPLRTYRFSDLKNAKKSYVFPEHIRLRENLNLNLGMGLNPRNRVLFTLTSLAQKVVEYTIETPLFYFLNSIPIAIKSPFRKYGWYLYSTLHKYTLGKSTGLHHSLSYELHALTTLLYSARFIPVNTAIVRFAMSQFKMIHPQGPSHTEKIYNADGKYIGTYVYCNKKQSGPRRVCFWCFGGAFLAGSVDANIGLAEKFCGPSNCDAFIPEYRLCPEYTLKDAQTDINEAYEWLVFDREVQGKDIKFLGISSGGGLALNTMQYIQAKDPSKQAAGGVLIGPWVEYDFDNVRSSQILAPAHDLIVNTSVHEWAFDKAEDMLGGGDGKLMSPLNKSMEGLPPILLTTSTHEIVFDENVELVNRLKAASNDIEFYKRDFMPHIFPLLGPFCPEGMEGEKRIIDFLGEW